MSKSRTVSNAEVFSAYLRRSVPAQWIAWWTELPDCDEKAGFAEIIFDGDQLRPLASKEMRSAVLDFIEASRLLRAMVYDEAQETVERIIQARTQIRSKRNR